MLKSCLEFYQHWNFAWSFRIVFYDAFKKRGTYVSQCAFFFFFFHTVILCIVEIKSLRDSLHLRPLIFSCEGFVIKFSYVHNEMDYSLPYYSHSWSFCPLSRSRLDLSIPRLWRMLGHCSGISVACYQIPFLSLFSFHFK